MTHLIIYLVCATLIAAGALSLVRALTIGGPIRSLLAILISGIPIGVGLWLLWSAGLRFQDFPSIVQQANQELHGFSEGFKGAAQAREQLRNLLGGKIK